MAPHTTTYEPGPPESRPRALLALIIVGVLLLAVPAMVAVIGYRSVTIHTPSSALVVGGDVSLDGAKIEVTALDRPHAPWVSSISRAEEWESPILLDPGSYHVTVTHRGTEILNENFEPHRLYGVRFDLRSMVLIIGSRALADATVEITYSGSNPRIPPLTAVKLTADAHYRQSVYLMSGEEYRAIAHAAGGQVLAQTDFSVDRHTPTRIDLGKIYDEGTE